MSFNLSLDRETFTQRRLKLVGIFTILSFFLVSVVGLILPDIVLALKPSPPEPKIDYPEYTSDYQPVISLQEADSRKAFRDVTDSLGSESVIWVVKIG